MWTYRARLERDLQRWRERGWIDDRGAEAIRADMAASSPGHGIGLSTALAVLGAVLIGFAAMTFVAANWQDMSRLARLLLLVVALWGCYGIAGALMTRGLSAFAHAAVLAGVGVFGASIMLIAQMYHIEGSPPDAVLIWALGALLAGVLLRSNPALATSMLLVALWTGWETGLIERIHWMFLPVWAAVAVSFLLTRWNPGMHLSAIVLGAWIVGNGYVVRGDFHWVVTLIGLVIVGGSVAAAAQGPDLLRRVAPTALCYGMVIAYMGQFAFTFFSRRDPGTMVMLSVVTLALLLLAVYWGWHTRNRTVLWLGYAGFSAHILAIYFRTMGTLIGTSLFFLLTGLIVMALSWLAYRLHAARPAAEASAP